MFDVITVFCQIDITLFRGTSIACKIHALAINKKSLGIDGKVAGSDQLLFKGWKYGKA